MMIEVLESVQKIVEEASVKYDSDIEKATNWAKAKVEKLPEYESIVSDLVWKALQEMIYDARHTTNVKMKREHGRYGGSAKVIVGSSPAVNVVVTNIYNYNIAGKVLGSLLGEELTPLSDSERAIGNGHLQNSRMLAELAAIVPANKRVKDAVSRRRLSGIFSRVMGGVKKGAA